MIEITSQYFELVKIFIKSTRIKVTKAVGPTVTQQLSIIATH